MDKKEFAVLLNEKLSELPGEAEDVMRWIIRYFNRVDYIMGVEGDLASIEREIERAKASNDWEKMVLLLFKREKCRGNNED